MMKVLLLNGSPRKEGNTFAVLREMEKTFNAEGVQTELIHVGNQNVHGCLACGKCGELGKCVLDDLVNEVAAKLSEADGLVIGSPVYYASPAGTLMAFLDRLFYSSASINKSMKVGASVAVARRAGTTATFDVLNKYFTISNMPVVSSQYWNVAHGAKPGEVLQDAEGMQTMRTLARNMTFLMKSIELGKKKFGLPKVEEENKQRILSDNIKGRLLQSTFSLVC